MFLPLLLPMLACPPPIATVTISPTGGGMDTTFQREKPSLQYDVMCPAPTATCPNAVTRVAIGTYYVYWAAEPEPAKEAAFRATPNEFPGTAAAGNLPLSVASTGWGQKLTLKVLIACLNNTSDTFYAPAAVIPPHLSISDRARFGAKLPDSANKSVPADQIPQGTKFRLTPTFHVWPRMGEKATVRITGPGIDFTKDYVDDPATTTTSDSHDVSDAYNKDPATALTATDTGAIKMWLEFEGTRSVELAYTVVPAASGTGGGGGGTGGSAGGAAPAGGCSAAGLGAPMLGVLLLLFRRRRA